MNIEEIFEEVVESEVECSQKSAVSRERIIQIRRFSICAPQPIASTSSHGEILQVLNEVKTTQPHLMSTLEGRLTAIENALKEKIPEKAEMQAQSKLLREVRVFASWHQQSLSRTTGDMEGEEYMELASKRPMASEENLSFVEEKLQNRASADAVAKDSKGSVDGVLRGLLADELVYHYNLEGRRENKSLLKLKSISIIMDIFADKENEVLLNGIRRFVLLSHNRLK